MNNDPRIMTLGEPIASATPQSVLDMWAFEDELIIAFLMVFEIEPESSEGCEILDGLLD